MKVMVVLVMALAVAPKPPTIYGCRPFTPVIDKVIETNPAVYAENDEQPGRVILPDGTAEWTFTTVAECTEPPLVVEPEDPANFAPIAPIEPGYDEHDPIGPTDDGAPGAPTVDHPDVPTP